MAKKKSRQQENAIKKIWCSHEAIFFLLVLAIAASFFLLVSRDNQKNWVEKDIVIRDISLVNIYRGSHYEITAEDGNTYSISGTNKNAEKLVRGNTYHIIYSHSHNNRIQSMVSAENLYVDHQESLRLDRGIRIAGWSGLLVSVAVACLLFLRISVKIRKIRSKNP